MELMRIKTSDIMSDENNPRRDFGDVKKMAEELTVTPWAKGEPINPLIVVRDGDGYRLADGARRLGGMRHLGIEECYAVVCGDYDEANNAIVALATDSKKPLSEVEHSRAVQSALQLGVPATTVEKAGGLKRGQAKRIQEAAKWAGEISKQTTTDQLLTAKELEERGASREEARSVLEAAPGSWRDAAGTIRERLACEQRVRELGEVLDAAGISPGAPGKHLGYDRSIRKAKDLKALVDAGAPEGAVFCINAVEGSVEVYMPVEEPMDGATEAARRAADAAVDACVQGADDRFAWYLAKLQRKATRPNERVEATPRVDAMLQRVMWGLGPSSDSIAEYGFEQGSFASAKALFAPLAISAYVDAQESLELDERSVRKAVAGDWDGIDAEALVLWRDWLATFKADGFALDAVEEGLLSEAVEYVGASAEPGPAEDGLQVSAEEELEIDSLLDATAAELRIEDEAAPVGEPMPATTDGSELDAAMFMFDGEKVV